MPQTTLLQFETASFFRWSARRARLMVRLETYVDRVLQENQKTISNRIRIAGSFLRDRIVANLSRPVRKLQRTRKLTSVDGEGIITESKQRYTVVDPESRSKPGEFPRADTTRLMKSIFHQHTDGYQFGLGHVGTPESRVGTDLEYGLILEYRMNRSFLRRTFNEIRQQLILIIHGGQP